jgi:Phage capsid family
LSPTIIETLRAATRDHRAIDQRQRLGEFLKVAQLVTWHGGNAATSADAERATAKVQSVLRAVIAPIGTTGAGAALADLRNLSEAFSTSLIGQSIFDTLLNNGMRVVPLNVKGTFITVAPSGSGVPEGNAKPISQLSLGSDALKPQKVWCAVAVTDVLLDFAFAGAAALFSAELHKGVARATDAAFLSQIAAGTTPIPATSPPGQQTYTFANLLTDLGKLIAAVDVEPGSRLYLVVPTSVAHSFSLMLTTGGSALAFPDLTITQGGPLMAGIELLVSDQLPPNRLLFIVADGLIANTEPFILRRLVQGDIQLSNSPDTPETAATVLQSLWQHNMRALAVERWFGFEVVRARSVASLSY